MSKDCDEITLLLDEPHGGDGGNWLLERLDRATAETGVEPRVVDDEPEFRVLTPNSRDQPPALAAPNETGTNAREDDAGYRLAASSTTALQNPETFSRNLVDTYFRQMGDAAWLSRDEEIALGKRIEASQQAVLIALCGVPKVAERIARWGHDVAEGRYRLADLVELPFFGM